MPKIVDHDARREEISAATLRVIERDGVENATIRAIAREGGFSSGALAHYFTDKEDIVRFAFESIAKRSLNRVQARMLRAAPGLPRVAIPLALMLPGSEERAGAVALLSFWARAANAPSLMQVYSRHYQHWRSYVLQGLEEARELGQLTPKLNLDDTADLLIAAIDGLAVGITLDPRRYPRARRKTLVASLLNGFTIPES